MESDVRFYRRRANEELAAANRAVTGAARERRMMLAEVFLERLKGLDQCEAAQLGLAPSDQPPAFDWAKGRCAERI